MSNKKSTGLGRNAFFGKKPSQQTNSTNTPLPAQVEVMSKPKKVRTTVTLYPDTLKALELMRFEARKTGRKVTMSEVLKDAVEELLRARGLETNTG